MNHSIKLRTENSELARLKDKIRKQHEVLTKENERLARKLEQVLRIQGKEPAEYIVVEEATTNLPKIEASNAHPNYVISPASSSSPRKIKTIYANDLDNLE